MISFFAGTLLSYHKTLPTIVNYYSITYLLIIWNFLEYIWHVSLIIIPSGDTETNPGQGQGLNICHLNLNSLSSHMYKKVSLLSIYISVRSTFQKLFSTPELHLMTKIWKYLVTKLLETIIHLTLNVCVHNKNKLPFKLINKKISSGMHFIWNKNRGQMLQIYLPLYIPKSNHWRIWILPEKLWTDFR